MPGLATAFAQGTLASRPAAGTSNEGYYYLATDVNGGTLYQVKSSAWVQLAPGVSDAASDNASNVLASRVFEANRSVPSSGVVAGSFGSGSQVPVLTIGADGRITKATTAAVSGGSGNVTGSTAFGSEPGSPSSGDLDLYSSANRIARYNGSIWDPYGPMHKWTKPPASTGGPSSSAFGWVNQNSATVDTTTGAVVLSCPTNSADSWTFLVKNIPTAPYTVTAHITPCFPLRNYTGIGLILRKASDGQFIGFNQYANTGSLILTVGHGTTTGPAITVDDMGGPNIAQFCNWVRIKDDNTNRTYWISPDGVNWLQVYTQARTTPFTPDQIGFGAESRNSSNGVIVSLDSWLEA